jgi:hypothetical protein
MQVAEALLRMRFKIGWLLRRNVESVGNIVQLGTNLGPRLIGGGVQLHGRLQFLKLLSVIEGILKIRVGLSGPLEVVV